MTTYIDGKAVGVGTIRAEIGVSGDVLHDSTLKGNGNTEPLGVDTEVVATTNQVGSLATTLNAAIAGKQDKLTAGENITIEDGVISATGGGSGGDYLPLSGGTVSGDVTVEGTFKVGRAIFKEQYNILNITPWSGMSYYQLSSSYFRGTGSDQTLGGGGSFWRNVYTKKLNNGEDIVVPTTGGTMALIEDIDAAVGDISTALTAILGE